MTTKKGKTRKLCILGAVALVVAVVLAIGIGLWSEHREQELETIQSEKLTELEQRAGEYDPQSIVLYDTSHSAAKKLAEKLGAELRITADGNFAALTLPEGVTIADIYADDDYRTYLEDMSVDYQVKTSDRSGESDGRLPTGSTTTVTDPYYELQTYLDYINLGSVWSTTTGSGVTVAVIDTGIDTDHPEFSGRISEYSYNATEDKIVKDNLLADGSYAGL